MPQAKNVLGNPLRPCCHFPKTGFYRDGFCHTGPEDFGKHVVCIKVTAEFLKFSQMAGNDLSTPGPESDFPGLIPGDRWCLCALRWQEALENDAAPEVYLEATHEEALQFIQLEDLKRHAVREPQDNWTV